MGGNFQMCVCCFGLALAAVTAAGVVQFMSYALTPFSAQLPPGTLSTATVVSILLLVAAAMCLLAGIVVCLPWSSLRSSAPPPASALVHVVVAEPTSSSPRVGRARSRPRARSESPKPLLEPAVEQEGSGVTLRRGALV